MKKSLLLTLCICVSICIFSCSTTKLIKPKNYKKDRALALEFFTLGNQYAGQELKELALEAYLKAFENDPTDAYLRKIAITYALDALHNDDAYNMLNTLDKSDYNETDWRFLGEVYLKKGLIDKSIEAYKTALAIDSSMAEAHYALGLIYSSQNKNILSIEEYRKARTIRDGPDEADEKAASAYAQNKMLDSAVNILKNLSKRNPDDIKYLIALGAAYEVFDKDSLARIVYDSILKIDSLNVSALRNIANIILRSKNSKDALPIFLKIWSTDTVNLSSTRALALLFFQFEKDDSAEIFFKKLLVLDTADAEPNYYLGLLFANKAEIIKKSDKPDSTLTLKNYNTSIDYYKKAIRQKSDFKEAYTEIGLTFLDMNKSDSALKAFTLAQDSFPTDSKIHFYKGITELKLKNTTNAVTSFKEAIKLDSTFKRAYFELATTYEQTGDFKNSEATFLNLLKIDPNFAIALNYLGYTWADKGINLKKAEELLKRALKLDPNNGAYLDSYGWLLYKNGDYNGALEYLLKAVDKIERPDAVLYDHLGDIYKAQNNIDKAQEYWKKALELDKENPKIKEKIN